LIALSSASFPRAVRWVVFVFFRLRLWVIMTEE
jgi:hypothetical protein